MVNYLLAIWCLIGIVIGLIFLAGLITILITTIIVVIQGIFDKG